MMIIRGGVWNLRLGVARGIIDQRAIQLPVSVTVVYMLYTYLVVTQEG